MDWKGNSLYNAMGTAADLVILNLLCAMCCLPLVTIGASLAAAHQVARKMTQGMEGPVVRSFFSAFGENFRQATVSFFACVLGLLGLVCNGILVWACFSGMTRLLLLMALVVMGLVIIGIGAHMRTLMTRYRDTLGGHFHNALLLLAAKPLCTAVVTVLRLLPAIVWMVEPELFWRAGIVWPVIGISGISFAENLLMNAALAPLEETTNDCDMELKGESCYETL